MNIDLADEVFQEKIYNQFLKLLSVNVVADKTTLIKYIKDFYRAKGSENAVRFLARILFSKEIEFYYPKSDILRASDGKWFVERSLKINNVRVDNVPDTTAVNNFANTIIKGLTLGTSGIVEKVDTYYDKGQIIYELKLSGVNKEFLNAEGIYAYYTEEGVDKYISANLFAGQITAAQIVDGGSGYTEGTTVPVVSELGSGAQIVISKVTKGSIKAAGILASGAGFQVGDDIGVTGGAAIGELPPSPANARISAVFADGNTHPNTFNVVGSTISTEANTPLGNVMFVSLNNANVNTSITDAMTYWTYGNTGPIYQTVVVRPGSNYTALPTLTAKANSVIRSIGALGRLDILDPGRGYQLYDEIGRAHV